MDDEPRTEYRPGRQRGRSLDWFGRNDGSIDVLLVDDNEQWARFMQTDLEDEVPKLDVTVALSANEAVLEIDNHSAFDCIVADYRMPEIDGLQLLERVREKHPEMPFILVTGEGDEDVASRAIDAEVSNYLVKDPRTEQTAPLATKIRNAVRQHRLQQAIRESEERYRTVTEQSRDGIAIFQPSGLAFWNRRLAELTGRDDDALEAVEFVSEIVHEGDRARVRDVLEALYDHKESGINDARLVTADGDVRHCEFTGSTITFENEPAALMSFRDVTARERRQRELAWERELNRTIQNVLLESRTRQELEAAVANQLVAHGYAMAWFAKYDDDQAVPSAITGQSGYVEQLDLSTGSGAHDSEPSIWALRSGEPKFVMNFGELFSTEWQEIAREAGFNSGAAVPLTYNDVTYGVLAVYHETTDRFDDTERKLLTELADTVAFAIHKIETERALASDHYVEVTAHLTGSGYYLTELARAEQIPSDSATFTVHGTVSYEDDVLQYVELADTDLDSFREAASTHHSVADVTVIDETTGRLQIHVVDPVPEAMLASRGVAINATTVRSDGAKLRLELPARDDVRDTVEILEEAFGPTDVQSVTERDRSETDDRGGDDLTDKQSAALRAAYHNGYFEQPRKNSASDVADALGVAHSTFLHHLRMAEQKIFDSRFA